MRGVSALLLASAALSAVPHALARVLDEASFGKDAVAKGLTPPAKLDTDHPHILDAASFAVRELQRLSESGIYETLGLRHIHYGAVQEGVFHNNTFLTLELASPHLLDAEATLHDVIVMADLEDGVRSLAIDEFPVMKEDAIEEFWIRRVEADKARREAVFRELEAEALAFERGIDAETAAAV